jgi:hypothetical protein
VNAALMIAIYIAVAAVLQGTAFLVCDPLVNPSSTTGLMLGLFSVALPISVLLFEKVFRRRPRFRATEPPMSLNVIDLMEAVRQRAQGRTSELGRERQRMQYVQPRGLR